MKIYIDSYVDVDYNAFYIKGLYDFFGRENVYFSNDYFRELGPNLNIRFVIIGLSGIVRYIIDPSDDTSIDKTDYEWSDCYGKINFNSDKTLTLYRRKIVIMPPSFGIKVWSRYESLYYGLSNLMKEYNRVSDVKRFLSKYYKQSKQLPIESYEPACASESYIYSINTLWNSDQWINNDATVNHHRANFIKVCKTLSYLNFEGGFVYSTIRNMNPAFQDLMIDTSRVSKRTYIEKNKASVLVFNTPAWALCHGWKLGEYLALGKAIISTPIINDLLVPLEHGKNIHIVSGEEGELRDAIEMIVGTPVYRKMLERNAREYYINYLTPIKSIEWLINSRDA
ncbi:hypothetical protein DYBT9275_02274 [Dyadobacter sp. CECT 9275]|uniref:Glycosyltransferase family 1 protein n=1 Tax=Dyadobacter helix TaxID=2822344 RepID=A0A916JBJ0_9BACT|nr:hypothetical protein [Dyadobacter sp. CECT 9275]CAG4999662.1 hypothetical protein DYBT9275_02274 [Dyadobacter sp. CECT 9275]